MFCSFLLFKSLYSLSMRSRSGLWLGPGTGFSGMFGSLSGSGSVFWLDSVLWAEQDLPKLNNVFCKTCVFCSGRRGSRSVCCRRVFSASSCKRSAFLSKRCLITFHTLIISDTRSSSWCSSASLRCFLTVGRRRKWSVWNRMWAQPYLFILYLLPTAWLETKDGCQKMDQDGAAMDATECFYMYFYAKCVTADADYRRTLHLVNNILLLLFTFVHLNT